MSAKKLKDKSLESRMSTVGPLLGLSAVIISVFSKLPPIIQYTMLVLLLMITIISIYVVFGEQLINFLKKMRVSRRHHSLTKDYFNEFNRYVDRLGEYLEPRRNDNIPHVLSDLQNKEPVFKGVLSNVDDFHDIFFILRNAVLKLRKNKNNFTLVVKWFEAVLNLYNKQLVCKPVDKIRTIGTDKVPEYVKENYKENREAYVSFLRDYLDFVKRMNKDFGEKIAIREHFNMPKEL